MNNKYPKWTSIGSAAGTADVDISGVKSGQCIRIDVKPNNNGYYRITATESKPSSTKYLAMAGATDISDLKAYVTIGKNGVHLSSCRIDGADYTSASSITVYKLELA